MWPKDDVSSQRMMEYCQKKFKKHNGHKNIGVNVNEAIKEKIA
jgi:hypothetical protein